MALNNIHAFGAEFDLKVAKQSDGKVTISILKGVSRHTYIVQNGGTAHVQI